MQTIQLNKFGTVLVSRPAGREAFQAIRPTLDTNTRVQIDFEGVISVTPSWFDEFLTNLADYLPGRIDLLPTGNTSVRAALPVLRAGRNDAAGAVLQRAMERMGIDEYHQPV